MAQFRYFAECGGATVQLRQVFHSGDGKKANDFTGTCPTCGQRHTAVRKIEYKANPSKHECDARCMGATGRSMQCECSCGGANHGKGFAVDPAKYHIGCRVSGGVTGTREGVQKDSNGNVKEFIGEAAVMDEIARLEKVTANNRGVSFQYWAVPVK